MTVQNGSLTIAPRALSIALDPQSKTYGDADPQLAYRLLGGSLVNGDTLALSRVAGEDAGSYALAASASPNYVLTTSAGELTILPRALNLAVDDATKVYGDADPLLSYRLVSGQLVGNDTLGVSLQRSAGENAGSYAIAASSLANGNYVLTVNDGTLTIAPASAHGQRRQRRETAWRRRPATELAPHRRQSGGQRQPGRRAFAGTRRSGRQLCHRPGHAGQFELRDRLQWWRARHRRGTGSRGRSAGSGSASGSGSAGRRGSAGRGAACRGASRAGTGTSRRRTARTGTGTGRRSGRGPVDLHQHGARTGAADRRCPLLRQRGRPQRAGGEAAGDGNASKEETGLDRAASHAPTSGRDVKFLDVMVVGGGINMGEADKRSGAPAAPGN
ncbi:hypothetical protein G4G31_06490 [Massilia sp. Se16.2.3]|nr:MBG-2 domain-containing protein [Massilia sp. Se16.2.3]QNA98566.1 hypothetical protein G4G31_06490 [Massilia sp. Se16.2.3]